MPIIYYIRLILVQILWWAGWGCRTGFRFKSGKRQDSITIRYYYVKRKITKTRNVGLALRSFWNQTTQRV